MREYGGNIKFAITEAGKKPSSFQEASAIVNEITKQGIEWTKGAIVYNVFKSAIAYETTVTPLLSNAAIESNGMFVFSLFGCFWCGYLIFYVSVEKLSNYEIESDDVSNFQEYLLASTIYGALLEAKASEESARMSAMDNATKKCR